MLFIFLTQALIGHRWQPKTVVSRHWCQYALFYLQYSIMIEMARHILW